MKHTRYNFPIVIISGPSGVGKTTILRKVLQSPSIKKRYIKVCTYTTRPLRKGERHKRDYFFVSKEEFLKLKKEKFFWETQKILDNYYGTPKYFLERASKEKKGLILCIDVKGAQNLIRKFKKVNWVTIFISVKSLSDLKHRLERRGEDKNHIFKRLELAKKELQFSKNYDYLLINQDLKKTVERTRKLLLQIFRGGYEEA